MEKYRMENAWRPRWCCGCGEVKTTCRNLVMLDKRAPVPGTGWGCVVCHLPFDGALAVICDDCLQLEAEIRWAVKGYTLAEDHREEERVPVDELQGEFEHDLTYHEDELADQELRN